jgi:hypothetical protein
MRYRRRGPWGSYKGYVLGTVSNVASSGAVICFTLTAVVIVFVLGCALKACAGS